MERISTFDRGLLVVLGTIYVLLLAVVLNTIIPNESMKSTTRAQSNTKQQKKAETLQSARANVTWERIPNSFALFLMAILIMLRSWRRKVARTLFVAGILLGVSELHTFKVFPQSVSYALDFSGSSSLFFWGLAFCYFADTRSPFRLIPMVGGILMVFLDTSGRLVYHTKTALLGMDPNTFLNTVDALTVSISLVGVCSTYLLSSPSNRRRLRWIVIGVIFSQSPNLLYMFPGQSLHDFTRTKEWFVILSAFYVFMPISFFLAVVADDALEIDGLTKLTTVVVLGVASLALVIQFIIPKFASQLSHFISSSPLFLRSSLTVSSSALLVWGGFRLFPALQDTFVPETKRLSQGNILFQQELSQVQRPKEIVELLGRACSQSLHPTKCHVLWYENAQWKPLDSTHTIEPPINEAIESFVSSLKTDTSLVMGWSPYPQENRPTDYTAALVLWQKEQAKAIIWLGPKGSHMPYSSQEKLVLNALHQQTTHSIQALLQKRLLEEQQSWLSKLQQAHDLLLEEQAESENRMATMSHDMKQPVEAIRLLSELLISRPLDQQTKLLLDNLHQSATSLRSILVHTLDKARESQKSKQLELSVISLSSLEAKLRSIFALQAHKKGLEFSIHLGEAQVQSEPILLERILQNLLTNAIRYTHKGSVTLTSTQQDNHVQLHIQDTGQGFTTNKQGDAFTMWQESKEQDPEGYGLGLAIVSNLSEMLGISVHIDSKPNQGTTFTLSIPKASL